MQQPRQLGASFTFSHPFAFFKSNKNLTKPPQENSISLQTCRIWTQQKRPETNLEATNTGAIVWVKINCPPWKRKK